MRKVWGVLILSLWVEAASASFEQTLFSVDQYSPECDRPAQMAVASPFFTTLGNDFPGMRAYNAMIRLYKEKRWDELGTELKNFKKIYETSPLQEPAAFLKVQVEFEKNGDKSNWVAEVAEKEAQEIKLLYPKSEFLPVLFGTEGNYWLSQKNYPKALSLYQLAKEKFTFHELECVFEAGIAESYYFLSEKEKARLAYRQVMQKCQNQRLRTLSQLRLLQCAPEMDYKTLENLVTSRSAIYQVHFPQVYLSIAENYYKKQQWKKADFYYSEYLNYSRNKEVCSYYAKKRRVDLTFFQKPDFKTFSSEYLALKENPGGGDLRGYTTVLGLLFNLNFNSPSEFQRKISVIDEQLEGIHEDSLRKQGFLIKWLTLVKLGETTPFSFLKKHFEKNEKDLEKVKVFLAEAILEGLEKKNDFLTESVLTDWVEIKKWITGTPSQNKIEALFEKKFTQAFQSKVKENEIEKAIAYLQLAQSFLSEKNKKDLFNSTLKQTLLSDSRKQNIQILMEHQEFLKPLTVASRGWIWDSFSSDLGNKSSAKRKISSLPSVEKERGFLDYYYLIEGQRLFSQGQFEKASSYFDKIQKESFIKETFANWLESLNKLNRPAKAYGILEKKFSLFEAETQKSYLIEMLRLAKLNKYYSKAKALSKEANKLFSEPKEKVGFDFFLSKSLYQSKKYSETIPALESYLKLTDDTQPDFFEAKFLLGKSYLKTGKKLLAKQRFQELRGVRDSFWSSLANNELKILN